MSSELKESLIISDDEDDDDDNLCCCCFTYLSCSIFYLCWN